MGIFYFPAKTRTESCSNPCEAFLQLVGLSPLWMRCHLFIQRFLFLNQVLINFDGIRSFCSTVETREKTLLQHSTFPGFHSGVNISLKFNSEDFSIVQCLSCQSPLHQKSGEGPLGGSAETEEKLD